MCGLAYDALGRRIKKVGSIAGTTNIYYYDDNWSATGGCLRTGPEMKPVCLFLRIVLVSLILAPAWGNAGDVLPKISFENTVCDLGQVGLGTKNSCEFKFTNTGQGPLKIANVKSTCGCTAAQLDKKEYAPGESGTIKATYTAPNTATAAQKSIYVSSNDKTNPSVRLTIKAEVVQIVRALPLGIASNATSASFC